MASASNNPQCKCSGCRSLHQSISGKIWLFTLFYNLHTVDFFGVVPLNNSRNKAATIIASPISTAAAKKSYDH